MDIGEEDKLISVREAAKTCDRNPETIRRWIWHGKLPAEKLGNQLFVRQSDLEKYLQEDTLSLHTSEQSIPEQINESNENQPAQLKSGQTMQGKLILPGSRREFIDQSHQFREEIKETIGNIDISETIRQLRGSV
jgi:excisionase family DNA binding protein